MGIGGGYTEVIIIVVALQLSIKILNWSLKIHLAHVPGIPLHCLLTSHQCPSHSIQPAVILVLHFQELSMRTFVALLTGLRESPPWKYLANLQKLV